MTDRSHITDIQLARRGNRELVDAELWSVISEDNLGDWEALWIPEHYRLLEELHDQGIKRSLWPQSRHWDWSAKTRAIELSLSSQCFSIMCGGVTQAMMITDLAQRAKLKGQKNDHLVYIDFLEVAPWNYSSTTSRRPSFHGCGSLLVGAAIEFSRLEGFKGRIGLHSLPQANNFYNNTIGMTDLGPDPDYQNLRYFELTQERAEAFITGGDVI